MRVVACLTINGFFQTRLIVKFDCSGNLASLFLPTLGIPFGRLIGSQPLRVFGENFFIGGKTL